MNFYGGNGGYNDNKLLFRANVKYPNDKDYCENSLTKAYGSHSKRYYNDFGVLFSDYDKESFDVVIMCNVLHEIDPNEWIKLFQPSGIISSCLKEHRI